MVAFNFDANTVRPNAGAADVLPSGVYTVQITNTEMKPTKDGAGAYLQVNMTVLDGDHKGATVVDRLNLQNNNSKAVEIAYGTLSAICHVTGVLAMSDTGQLHGRPFKVKVLSTPRQDDPTKMGNELKGYYDVHGNEPGAGNAGPSGAPAQPAAPQQPPASPPQAAPAAPASAPAAAPAPVAAPAAPVNAPPAQVPAPAPTTASAPPATPPWAS